MPKVKIYTTSTCQYCRLVKAYLSKHNIPYEETDVGADRKAAEEMVAVSGQYGVPVTMVGDELIVGFDVQRLNQIFGKVEEEGLLDVLIIGGGPAGLTAAMYAARKMLRGIIITENIGGQALESWAIENYMGYRMVTGEELIKKFEDQVRDLNIRIELDSVVKIAREDGLFRADTVSEKSFIARSVIITSGVKPRWLGIEDEEQYIGHGMSVCSTCDGPLFRDKVVGVVGGGNYALTTAIEMSRIAKQVYLIVRSTIRADAVYTEQFEEIENIRTYLNYVVSGLHGDQYLDGITIKERDSGETIDLAVDGLFLAIGHQPNTDFLDGLLELNEKGEIVIDINCNTNIPGIFAAGDVTSVKGKQVIIASGEGAKAALEVYEYLMKSNPGEK
jgi:alkyl hydroperoxide reductase subunit F